MTLLTMFAVLLSCGPTDPPAPEDAPLGLDRAQLWNFITTGDPDSTTTPGELPPDPHYASQWPLFPHVEGMQPFENLPLDLPTHGRFVTVYANHTAHTYVRTYLNSVKDGQIPQADLPAGSVIVKVNYPAVLKNGQLEQAAEPAVLTVAYKPGGDFCQLDKTYNGEDCLGGNWRWAFYGLNAAGDGPQRAQLFDAYVGDHTEAFCVNCHDPGVRTDYLRGLQRMARRVAAEQRPVRAPAAVPPDEAWSCEGLPISSDLPTDVPVDPNSLATDADRQKMFDCFAWRSFIALNWPAAPEERGVASPMPFTPVTPDSHRVWETYKATWELFQPEKPDWNPEAAPAGRWETPRPWPVQCEMHRDTHANAPMLSMTAKTATHRDVANETGQAFAGSFGTLTDRNGALVRYQVLFNRDEFDVLVPTAATRRLTPGGPDQGEGVFLPEGATEVKAAWRELCTGDNCPAVDDPTNYYTRDVLVYDRHAGTCSPRTMGLVGLHIARKTWWAPQWVWATFEHRQNAPLDTDVGAAGEDFSFYRSDCGTPASVECAAQPFLAPSGLGNPCCPNAELNRSDDHGFGKQPNRLTRLVPLGGSGLNEGYATALAGSVWANYVLVNTQWPLNGRGEPGVDGLRPVNMQLCKDQWDVMSNPLATRGPPPRDCYSMQPAVLRNTSMESYMSAWFNHGGEVVEASNRSCMGCHASGTDFSFIWLDGVEQIVDLP